MNRRLVAGSAVMEFWWAASEQLSRAIPYCNGTYTLDDILRALLRGDMQLWMFFNAIEQPELYMVSQVTGYPSRKVLDILFVAGSNAEAHFGDLEAIEAWAKLSGCEAIQCHGRLGWLRKHPLAYKPTHVVFSRELP